MKEQKMKNNVINYTKNILPILWNFLETRRNACSLSINICNVDGEIVISIIDENKITRFKHQENIQLAKNLNTHLMSF